MQNDGEKYKAIRKYALQLKEKDGFGKGAGPKSILKKSTRFRKFVHNLGLLPLWFLGTRYEIYRKPVLSHGDLTFMLLNVHINFRSFCRFVDHTITRGPVFVTICYTAVHLIVCPPLCYLYGFLGRYGERSFISIWQMCPIMQGISAAACILECFKIIETSLLISSAIIMLASGYYTDYHMFSGTPLAEQLAQGLVTCNATNYNQAVGVNYGLSRIFSEIGHNLTATGLMITRVQVVIGIWLAAILWRLIKSKSFVILMKRVVPSIIVLLIMATIIVGLIGSIGHKNKFEHDIDMFDIMHVTAFAVADYLPTHWVTIGFITNTPMTQAQVIGTAILSNAVGVGLSWSLMFYLHDYAAAIDLDMSCLTTYGLEYFFVVIPYAIRYRSQKVAIVLIPVYIIAIIMKGISYIYANHALLMWAFESWSVVIYRFRNVLGIATMLALGACAVPLCVPTCHDLVMEMHDIPFYHGQIMILLLTLIGIAIYGIWHLSADHQFSEGKEYPSDNSLKMHIIVNFIVFISYVLCLLTEYKQILSASLPTIIILALILIPLGLGVIKTLVMQKAYHGIMFRPLPTWGSANVDVRDHRRRHNLRQMFVTRCSRECGHNCLTKSVVLENEIMDELELRDMLLDTIEEELRKTRSVYFLRESSNESGDMPAAASLFRIFTKHD